MKFDRLASIPLLTKFLIIMFWMLNNNHWWLISKGNNKCSSAQSWSIFLLPEPQSSWLTKSETNIAMWPFEITSFGLKNFDLRRPETAIANQDSQSNYSIWEITQLNYSLLCTCCDKRPFFFFSMNCVYNRFQVIPQSIRVYQFPLKIGLSVNNKHSDCDFR